MNFLFNALEAIGHNGVLTVQTEMVKATPERQLRINIQDTGVGIAPEIWGGCSSRFFTTKINGTAGAGHQPAHCAGASRLDRVHSEPAKVDVQPVAAGVHRSVSWWSAKSGKASREELMI